MDAIHKYGCRIFTSYYSFFKVLENAARNCTSEDSGYYKKNQALIQQKDIFLKNFKRWTLSIVIISTLLQMLFFPTIANAVGSFSAFLGWYIICTALLVEKNLYNYTISTMVILGYGFVQYFMPLVFTLAEGKPIVYNLNYPITVFMHSLLCLTAFLISHSIYKYLEVLLIGHRKWLQYKLSQLHIFAPLSDKQVWIIGGIGFVGILFRYVGAYTGEEEAAEASRGVLSSFLIGFMPYAYAPLLLLIRPMYNSYETKKPSILLIILYVIILIVVGIVGNSRGLFMRGIIVLAIAYFLGLLLGIFSSKIINGKNVLIAGLGVFIITGPLADLATAMVIVRSQRYDSDSVTLLNETLNEYSNEEAIDEYNNSRLEIVSSEWDETYLDNVFLSRFSNLKFADLSLDYAFKIGVPNEDMQGFAIDRILITLPQPLISALGINFDKTKAFGAGSYGDQFYYRYTGNATVLGSFRVGHFFGTGMAIFGIWYVPLLVIFTIPLYFLGNLLVLYNGKTIKFSFLGLINLGTFFLFWGFSSQSESQLNVIAFVFRAYPQLILLFFIIMIIVRKIK
ncbi:hypothetical protein ACLI09_10970 [Flavobacterium sp. RHBU_24]|uniref:hypothetical protein n=1 Tax=Flavobacterium sp. RHBU_24 TaxID=3391185 RepID=UPI00398490A3